jgi:hypothetical protein
MIKGAYKRYGIQTLAARLQLGRLDVFPAPFSIPASLLFLKTRHIYTGTLIQGVFIIKKLTVKI